MCKEELNQQGIINVDKWLAKGFSQWFKTHVRYLAFDQFTRNFPCVLFTLVLFVQIGKLHEKNNVSDDLFALACEPDKRVRLYSACIVDGVRYHTVDREKDRKSQNSGIFTEGEHEGADIDFYGQLKSIIKLQYNTIRGVRRSVVLFRCDWFDLSCKKTYTGFNDDGHFISINTGKCWYKNDPFILTTQATMVFYVPDTRLHGNWRVVQKFQHRHLWSVTENEIGDGPGGIGLSYQDDDTPEVPVQAQEANVQTRLRRDREGVFVEAAVVERMKKRRKEVVDGHESEDDEEIGTDDTILQYCSDGENDMDDDE